MHVVMAERPVGAGNPIPHNHQLWALIGVTHGSEENEFFRRSAHAIEPSGSGRVITEGEVLRMGDDTIHSVKNPSTDRLSSALQLAFSSSGGSKLIATTRKSFTWLESSAAGTHAKPNAMTMTTRADLITGSP